MKSATDGLGAEGGGGLAAWRSLAASYALWFVSVTAVLSLARPAPSFAARSRPGAGGAQTARSAGRPAQNQRHPAAPFIAPDVAGKLHALGDYRGRRVALFFFCGCIRCQECAQLWAQMQRNALPPPPPATAPPVRQKAGPPRSPITLVVFAGDAAETRAFARARGLDPARTVLFPDPDLRLTLSYHALPCPRAFVLDGAGRIIYTNDHADDAPQTASAMSILSRVQASLAPARRLARAPAAGRKQR